MKITEEFLKQEPMADDNAIRWWKSTGEKSSLLDVLKDIKDDRVDVWRTSLIPKCFNKEQCVELAIFASRRVLPLFENKYPEDNRPRVVITTAEKWLASPTEENTYAAKYASTIRPRVFEFCDFWNLTFPSLRTIDCCDYVDFCDDHDEAQKVAAYVAQAAGLTAKAAGLTGAIALGDAIHAICSARSAEYRYICTASRGNAFCNQVGGSTLDDAILEKMIEIVRRDQKRSE